MHVCVVNIGSVAWLPTHLSLSLYTTTLYNNIIQQHYTPTICAGTVNKTGDTPLSLACVNGHLEMIKYFIIIHGCIINGD